jgi:zinc transport system ATP-binding protein
MAEAPIQAGQVLLEVVGVSARFGRHEVLNHVDLTLKAGRIVTLIGPNGSGKTTLVRVLLGLETATEGSIIRRAGLRIGYMPQHMPLDPVLPLSAGRFLALAGADERAAISRSLAEVGAAGVIDSPFHGLSGGELQRVLLARALLRNPDLLVLDEPLRGVDVTGQVELYDLINRIRRTRGCGVLMVSHDLHLVMAATDEVVCLNHHVCCAGRPEAVTTHPEYLALFGPAADRFAVYTHRHDHEHGPAGDVLPLAETETDRDHSRTGTA